MNDSNNRYPTNLNNSIGRAQGASDNRYTGNRNGNNRKSGLGLLILPLIFIASVLPDGFGFALIPLLILGVTGFAVYSVVKAQKQAQGGTSARPASGTTYTKPAPRREDGHLCDDDQHITPDPNGFNAIEEMEAGYRPASTATLTSVRGVRTRALTPEEYQRKNEELRDLLAAGVITHEEYRHKLDEYRK